MNYNWEEPYNCKKCGESFETQSDVQKHIKQNHFKKFERQGKAICRRKWR